MKNYIRVNISSEDKALVQQIAQKQRLSASSYCRNLILNKILSEDKA